MRPGLPFLLVLEAQAPAEPRWFLYVRAMQDRTHF